MGGNTAKREGAEDSHRENRAQESTPPHNGQKPGSSVRQTQLRAPDAHTETQVKTWVRENDAPP